MQTRADRTQEQSFSSRARVKESQKESAKDLDRQCRELLSQNRGREACTLIARVLGSEVQGYCRGMMASESTGDNLYQDVLGAVLVGLPSFQLHRRFTGYMPSRIIWCCAGCDVTHAERWCD